MIQAGLLNKQCVVSYEDFIKDASGNILKDSLGNAQLRDIMQNKKCHIKDLGTKLDSDNEYIRYKHHKVFVFRKGYIVPKYRKIEYKGITYNVIDINYNEKDVTYEITCESIID